jgi:hypothetical protein
MSETKHTPGPWRISESGIGFEVEAVIDGHQHTIAQSQQLRSTDRDTIHVERKANAVIMAAAPDLLAALEVAWAVMDEGPEHDMVGAAIRKAKGEA